MILIMAQLSTIYIDEFCIINASGTQMNIIYIYEYVIIDNIRAHP